MSHTVWPTRLNIQFVNKETHMLGTVCIYTMYEAVQEAVQLFNTLMTKARLWELLDVISTGKTLTNCPLKK